jgi:putative endonuclease
MHSVLLFLCEVSKDETILMARHNETGQIGESLAKVHLQDKGYQIVSTNWRWRQYEIDVIAMHDDTLVFIEVKTRTNGYFGHPETQVDGAKQRAISRAASAYIEENDYRLPVRFDIVAITFFKDHHEIAHFEDAFFPSEL